MSSLVSYMHTHIYQALEMPVSKIFRFGCQPPGVLQEENGQNYLFWLHRFLKWFAHLLKQVYTSSSMKHLNN